MAHPVTGGIKKVKPISLTRTVVFAIEAARAAFKATRAFPLKINLDQYWLGVNIAGETTDPDIGENHTHRSVLMLITLSSGMVVEAVCDVCRRCGCNFKVEVEIYIPAAKAGDGIQIIHPNAEYHHIKTESVWLGNYVCQTEAGQIRATVENIPKWITLHPDLVG